MAQQQDPVIGGRTKIELALLSGIFMALVGASWGASSWATRIEIRIQNIEERVVDATGDRWTASEQRNWVRQFSDLNPDLKFPIERN